MKYVDRETGELKPLLLRTENNYDMDAATLETGVDCSVEPSRTMQQFAEECDINEIVRKFGITGQMPDNLRMPSPADFTDAITDFQTAMDAVVAAQNAFLEVPGELRARFDHDAGKLMAWLDDPENQAEAVKLGFSVPRAEPKPPEPMPVRVVTDDKTSSAT